MDPKYSDGIYANAEKTVIVLKGLFGFDKYGGEIAGPVIATKDDPDTGDLFTQATSKAAPFGAIAAYVAPPFNSAPVKSECQRRIYAIASQNAQMNMTAYVASGLASNADKTAFAHSLEWVAAMRAASAGLIEDEDVTFGSDSHWPACPADVVELTTRF